MACRNERYCHKVRLQTLNWLSVDILLTPEVLTNSLRQATSRPLGGSANGLKARNVAIAAQAADMVGREGFPSRGLASLPIEDAGDDFIRIKTNKAAK